MNELEALHARHSVRRYLDEPMGSHHAEVLQSAIDAINAENGLHFQLVLDDPAAFKGSILGYGLFKNVRNYIALVGPDTPELNHTCGYQGQKLVLLAQRLGLNTCWVGMKNFSRKAKCTVDPGEKLALIIAVGT
ncbi:MAG: nitroreductase, partial [Eggerthellaceae bacterium]|nr:nitroreductase [Eggerthellaceae bacterium]